MFNRRIPKRGRAARRPPKALLGLTETDSAVLYYICLLEEIHDRSVTPKIITETTGIPGGSVRPSFAKLLDLELINSTVGHGRYRSADEVNSLQALEAYLRVRFIEDE